MGYHTLLKKIIHLFILKESLPERNFGNLKLRGIHTQLTMKRQKQWFPF